MSTWTSTIAALACGVAAVLAALPATAEDPSNEFNAGWDDPSWAADEAARRQSAPGAPAATGSIPERSLAPPSFQVGGSEVRLEAVDGAPGARITPGGSDVSLGVGIAPRPGDDPNPLAGFGTVPAEDVTPSLDNGFMGAFSLSETDGSVTQSMSVTTPLSGDSSSPAGRDANDGFKTMFGLGYHF